jgi:hypothetical protein
MSDPDGRGRAQPAGAAPPGVRLRGGLLRIARRELGLLAGLSHQRVDEAQQALQAAGFIGAEDGGVGVLDLEPLRGFGRA